MLRHFGMDRSAIKSWVHGIVPVKRFDETFHHRRQFVRISGCQIILLERIYLEIEELVLRANGAIAINGEVIGAVCVRKMHQESFLSRRVWLARKKRI